MIKPQIVNKLKSIHEVKFLMQMEGLDSWTHNIFNRQQMASSLFIAEITLKCMLSRLTGKGILEKVSKGIYKISKDAIQ